MAVGEEQCGLRERERERERERGTLVCNGKREMSWKKKRIKKRVATRKKNFKKNY